MKKYIRSSKKFYGQDGEFLDIERESKTLTYDSSFDGDYYKGNYHIFVRFYDTDGNECLISKIYDDSISEPKQEKMKVDRSGDQIRFRDIWM